jgi:hypothetical protein
MEKHLAAKVPLDKEEKELKAIKRALDKDMKK